MDEIARRRLTRDDGQPVTVVFYRPEYSPGAWRCYWRVEGMDDSGPVEQHSYGDDSVQALVLALGMVDTWLKTRSDHTVVWHEEFGDNLGFHTLRPADSKDRTDGERAASLGLTEAELRQLREQAKE